MIPKPDITSNEVLPDKNKTSILYSLALLIVFISCENIQEFEHPMVFTGEVTNITDTSALFTAKISSLGNYPVVESGFVWGAHSNDNNGIKIANSGDVTDIYSLKTNERLLSGMTYYVRAYILTESAISYGREVSFNTPEVSARTGKWVQENADADFFYGSIEFIKSSFTINGITYLVLNFGRLYSYNHETKVLRYEFTDPIIDLVDYSIVKENNVYVFSGNSFYLFNPQDRVFNKLASLQGEGMYGVTGFSIENNIYIGLGIHKLGGYTKEFRRYNIAADNWQDIASFPGDYRTDAFSYSLNDKGYVGGGFNVIQGRSEYPIFNDLWSYKPETDQWLQKESFPFKIHELYALRGKDTGRFGYGLFVNMFFEYNPVFDIWVRLSDIDNNRNLDYPHMFTVDDKVFIMEVRDYMGDLRFNLWSYEK